VFFVAGKHVRRADLNLLTFEQILLFSACGRPGTKFYVGGSPGCPFPLSPPRIKNIFGLFSGSRQKKTQQTSRQIDRFWDRKTGKTRNLQTSNLLSKKTTNTTDEQTDRRQI
jgi:hypothetical protein